MRTPIAPNGLRRLIAARLFSRTQWRIWVLAALVLAAYAVNIKLAVLYNDWNGRFFNALQAVNKAAIFGELFYFIGLAAAIIILLVWAGYIKDRLMLALRRDLTEVFFKRWLSPQSAHYLLRESGKEPDNPDQRIAEDVRLVVSLSVSLAVSLYDSLLTVGSFSVILWQLSGSAEVWGFTIPGYMFWVCVFYTIVASGLTHLIGRKLKPLNINAQHMEANLRAALMEKRRHADAIAGAHAESVEEASLSERFHQLLRVLIALVKRKRDLNLFTVGIGQFTHLAPIFFALPSFLAGVIQLGGLMQIRGAFNDVARSLSWIIMSYEELAALAAAYERLERLESGLTQADHTRRQIQALNSADSKRSDGLSADILLKIPRGRAAALNAEIPVSFSLKPGSLAIITGPSGIGKTTLLRVLAGFSESFTGCIRCGGSVLWMPQTPYLPKGELFDALAYPKAPDELTDERAAALLSKARLTHLTEKFRESADWSTVLSGGEVQRLSLLRALIAKPDVLLLDEMTSGLDPVNAREMIELLGKELPHAVIVLVTHQAFLYPLADQIIQLKGEECYGESIHPIAPN